MEQRHVDEALKSGYMALGPSYFSAREHAEQFMEGFEAEHFKPLIKSFSDKFAETMWEKVEYFLASDLQSNIQSRIWRDVDDIVKAILGGEQWIWQRYVLGDRYEVQPIRETLAKLIPKEIQDGRIADLEAKVSSLQETIDSYRERW